MSSRAQGRLRPLGVLLCAYSLSGEWCGEQAASSRAEERADPKGPLARAITDRDADYARPQWRGELCEQLHRHRGTQATDPVKATR